MPFKNIDVKNIIETESVDPEFKAEFDKLNHEYELIEEIVRLRRSKHLSQVELAKAAGVSQQAISRLEREKHIPKLDTLIRILEGLNMKITLTPR